MGILCRVPWISVPGCYLVLPRFVVVWTCVVAINRVSKSRYQQAQSGCSLTEWWANEQRDGIVVFSMLESNAVDPGPQIFGDCKGEISLPFEIVDIIFVKMNGSVVLWRMAPAHLGTVPIGTRHSPCRVINQRSMELVNACVNDTRTRNFVTEIPARKNWCVCGLGGVEQNL